MAAKDSQGLQAIIIVLVILVILLSAGLIFVNNAKKTAQARATEAETRADSERNAHAKANSENNNLKLAIGFPEADTFEAVKPIIDEDLARYGQDFEAENRAYRKLLEANAAELRSSALNEESAKARVQELSREIEALQAQSNQKIAAAEAQLKATKDDMAAERSKFDNERAEFKRKGDEISAQLAAQRDEHAAKEADLNTEINRLAARVENLTRANVLLQENQIEPDPFAEPPDGKITWVNQRNAKAWIDVGSADGLRAQVTFSVYAPTELDASSAAKKASIEVVRVVGPHLSEVRITSDDPRDPIIPGDKIYSQVWDRGRKLGFAIAGDIDLDGDGVDDLDLLKRIITASNGSIHAAPGMEETMSVKTRFLILGEYPSGSQPGAEQLREHWAQTAQKADDLNIETIAVDEFVKMMGWRSENKAVTLGADARPIDFPAVTRDQALPRKPVEPQGAFRKRLPPTPY